MFLSNSPFTKNLVIILITFLCLLFTLITIISWFSAEKKPDLVAILFVILFDIVWVLLYLFYVSKK